MQRTVALTGASGFVGRAIASRLCQAGFLVRALVRRAQSFPELEHSSLTTIRGSLEDTECLQELVQGCANLIHCAGVTHGRTREDFISANVNGVENVLKACHSQPSPPRLVHISSLAAREPSLSPYAWSKNEGERIVEGLGTRQSWVILRPPAVYGPHDKALLPLLLLAGKGIAIQLGASQGRFSLIHVNDLADAVLHILESPTINARILEVDDGFRGGYSWHSIFTLINPEIKFHLKIPQTILWGLAKGNEICSKFLGYAPLLTTGKVAELRHYNWVCQKTEDSDFHWKPRIPLQDGLRQLLPSDSLKAQD